MKMKATKRLMTSDALDINQLKMSILFYLIPWSY